jgi:hypothetical protein
MQPQEHFNANSLTRQRNLNGEHKTKETRDAVAEQQMAEAWNWLIRPGIES